jgi:HAD superfamily hydrolase (TIGR01549 family)
VIAILDVDGTLVDTNYQHALAWYRAFREHGIVLPVWRAHRAIGMGGDQLVAALTDDETEQRLGDALRSLRSERFAELIGEVETIDGSRELLVELKERGHRVVLASSANADEIEHYLDLLDARQITDAWTTSEDVESTKPAPDLVAVAIDRAGAGPDERAILVGDSTWDIKAARNAGVDTLAVRTGGFGADELREAGALDVYESVDELRRRLGDTPLG